MQYAIVCNNAMLLQYFWAAKACICYFLMAFSLYCFSYPTAVVRVFWRGKAKTRAFCSVVRVGPSFCSTLFSARVLFVTSFIGQNNACLTISFPSCPRALLLYSFQKASIFLQCFYFWALCVWSNVQTHCS